MRAIKHQLMGLVFIPLFVIFCLLGKWLGMDE